MKLISISDTHGSLPDFLPSGDVLTISGDISPCVGSHHPLTQEFWFKNKFTPYLESLIKDGKFKDIVFVFGNHDFYGEKLFKDNLETKFRSELPSHVHYLRDSEVIIDGVRIYGTPWTPKFGNWAFMARDEILHNHFMKISNNVDILLSHGPIYGYNDTIDKPIYESQKYAGHLGSKVLFDHVKRAQPKLVCVGHIHSGNHNIEKIMHDPNDMSKYSETVNVSILDEEYEPFYTNVLVKGI